MVRLVCRLAERTASPVTGRVHAVPTSWLFLACLQMTLAMTMAKPLALERVISSGSTPHDWCASNLDRNAHLEQLQASLKSLDVYDWDLVLIGLDRVYKMTIDAWRFADSILGDLVEAINDDEEFINGMANVYLTYAPTTPEAVRFTDENSVERPTTEQAMAEHLQNVLIKQSENLARMLARLDLLHSTERDLGDRKLEQLMYGSMGETQFVLCAMQHLFRIVSPGYDLPGRYTKSDLSEFEQDTLGTSHHIRMYAAYGVIQRHADIIQMVKEDIRTLSEQVRENTGVKR